MTVKIQLRRDSGVNWTSSNPVLAEGEIGINTTIDQFKIGDGTTAWNSLGYSSANISLNDIGDVTITSAADGDFLRWNGSAWINDAVNLSTDTVGNYVDSLVAGTGVTLSNNSGEGATPTIAIGQSVAAGDSPTFAGLTINGASIILEGATADDFETTLTVTDPTADRTITFQDATGTVALTSDITTHANLTEAHGATGAVVGTTNTQTLTNKTLTSPKVNEDVVLTSTATELNVLDGITSSTAELNILDGVTSSAAELNILDGATLSTAELNYVDGVTSAIQTQIDAKAPLANPTFTGTVAGITKTMVGLGSVDNTADTAKPVSTAQQTALDLKANLASPTFTGTPTLPTGTIATTQTASNNTTAVATTAYVDTADALKANLASPTFTGTPTLPTGTIATTQTAGNNTTAIATTAYVDAADALKANLASPTFTGTVSAADLTLSGNLTVNGTTTTINSTTITVDDKNIELGSVATPTDVTADGGGITLKGTTDKTINWIDATDAWTSSEDFNLLTGKAYEINGTSVLNATTLGSAVTGSSLTSVGTIGTGTWQGTAIAGQYGGTGVANTGKTITLAGNLTTTGAYNITLNTASGSNVTLPLTGTLVNEAVTTLSGLSSIGTVTTGTWNGTAIAGQYGGTGVNNSGKTITLGGNLTTSGMYSTTLTVTANTSVTLPTTGTLATLTGTETFTNKTLTSPSITGASSTALTSLGIRDTSAAYDITIAAVSSTALTAGRTLTLDLVNAAKTLKFGGNLTLASDLTTSGAFALTLTQTASTNITLPTTGTLATLAGTETFTNKTFTSPVTNTPTLTLSTTSSTTDARLSWDSTNKKLQVGNGTISLDFASSNVITNAQVASYTLVLADKDKLVEVSNASANTLTVPLNSSVAFPVGTQITILQTGAGQTTITATGGVTINATPGLKLRAQWSSVTLIKRATDTWVALGDLQA